MHPEDGYTFNASCPACGEDIEHVLSEVSRTNDFEPHFTVNCPECQASIDAQLISIPEFICKEHS